MTINEFAKRLQTILQKDYDHERPDVLRSKEYNREWKKYIKSILPNCTITSSNCYCEFNCFITAPNGKCVYVMTFDYRYDNPFEKICYRTAKDEKDYTGGMNHWTDIYELKEELLTTLS